MYGYYITCTCRDPDDKKIIIDIPVKFKDKEQYELFEGDGFDMLYDHFDKWLKTNNLGQYFVDDQPEQCRPIAVNEFPNNSLDLTSFKI